MLQQVRKCFHVAALSFCSVLHHGIWWLKLVFENITIEKAQFLKLRFCCYVNHASVLLSCGGNGSIRKDPE